MSRGYVVICQEVCKALSERVIAPPFTGFSCLGIYETQMQAMEAAVAANHNETCRHFVLATQ